MRQRVDSQERAPVDTRLACVEMLVAREVQSFVCCCSQVHNLKQRTTASIFNDEIDQLFNNLTS